MIKAFTKIAQQFSTQSQQPKKKSRKLLYGGLAFLGFNIIVTSTKTRNYLTNLFLTDQELNELKQQNKIDIRSKSYKVHDINQQFDQIKPIIIIGGGIIGLSQALKLLQNGYSVVLIEKEKFVSTKCSAFNGNIYNPYLFNPLVSKYSIKTMIKNYYNPTDSATQRFSFNSFSELNGLIWWINALILSTSDFQFDLAVRDMTKLGEIQEKEFEKVKQLGLLEGQLTAKGELSFYKSVEYGQRISESFQQAGVQFTQANENQYQHSLDKQLFSNFPYVIKLEKESNLDTKQLSMNTLKYCEIQYPQQFKILYGNEFKEFVLNRNFDCLGINTNHGIIFGSKIIICAGLNSKYIAQKLGVRLPIMPCKGWVIESSIPQFAKGSVLDQMVLKLPTLSITNLNDKLRISGCQSIDKDYKSPNPINEWGARILISQMKEQFNIELDEQSISVRDCSRPLTPDDKVILCRLEQNRNVFINAGHGSRGMSQCHGCAEVIYQLMKGTNEYPQFNISRFLFA